MNTKILTRLKHEGKYYLKNFDSHISKVEKEKRRVHEDHLKMESIRSEVRARYGLSI